MEYNALVSVVMPVHNGEKYLRESIESVLNQTYKNFEFLIIENCSVDSSVEIIKSYNDSRIRMIVEEDCGIVQGYNRGFREARGELIVVHDQDDVSFLNRIESLVGDLISKNLDICGSSFEVINGKNQFIKQIKTPISQNDIIQTILYDVRSLFNPTLLIRKKTIEDLNYFDKSLLFGADYDFMLRSLTTHKVGNSSDVLLKYRIHKNSTSRKYEEVGANYLKKMSLKYYEEFYLLLNDRDFVIARIYYFFENYFRASKYFIKSLFRKGFYMRKLKYISYSTFLAIPISIIRKYHLNFNRFLNFPINTIKRIRRI